MVLCCRILTIILLVFAFAQPFPKTALKPLVNQGTNYVSIAIDNSFSMETNTENGTLLEQSKQKAKEWVQKFKPSDRFALITQDFSDDNQRFVSKEEMLDAIENLKIVPFSHTLSEWITRQKNLFKNISTENKSLFVLSDFQKTMVDAENLSTDTLLQTYLSPIQSKIQNNISIDSISLETPVFQVGNEIEFQIWLSNHSEQTFQEIPVKLWLNNELISVGNVNFEPRQTKTIRRKLTLQQAGYCQGYFEISDYPITFDDRLYFTLNILEKIPVLLLTESKPNSFLMKLLEKNESFDLKIQNLQNPDYSMLNKVNFVILDELKTLSSGLQTELRTAIEAGLSLLILPGEQIDLTSFNNLIKPLLNAEYQQIEKSKINVDVLLSEHPIYRSAFVKLPEKLLLPEVQQYFPIQSSARSNLQYLLKMNNNLPFLAFGNVEKGRIYLSSVPFANEFSNFQNQPIFVVSLLNMILQSVNNEQIYNILTSGDAHAKISLSGGVDVPPSEVFYLKLENSDFEVIPQMIFRGREALCNVSSSSLKHAGNYLLQTKNQPFAKLSYNFDRRESDLQTCSQSELEQLLQKQNLQGFSILEDHVISPENNLLTTGTNTSWWKWCLIFALIFLLTEALILRFYKA